MTHLFLIAGLVNNVLATLGVIYDGNMAYYVNIMQQHIAASNPPSSKTMNMELSQVDTL